MSKYKEMCDAAETARKNWIQYRGHCWQHMASLVDGLVKYCGIPGEHVTFLKWNKTTGEGSSYTEAGNGMKYTLQGAMEFDDEGDRYWHLGVCITVTPPNTFPPQWVSFALCVTEQEGKPMVKVGDVGKPRQIDFNDSSQTNELYDGIVESIKKSFADPQKSAAKTVGFNLSS